MAIVPNDSAVRFSIFPSVWAAYTLPHTEISGQKFASEGVVSTKHNIPQKWLDGMFEVFQNGSVADFYDRYLGRTLPLKEQEKILLNANKILTADAGDLPTLYDRLPVIAAIDIASSAYVYGDCLFQTACFLEDQGKLPKECRFMLARKINPAFYKEKELFETAQHALSEPMKKIPDHWMHEAFAKWVKKNDASDEYLFQMQKMAALNMLSSCAKYMPVECAIKEYVRRNSPVRHRSLYSRCRSTR